MTIDRDAIRDAIANESARTGLNLSSIGIDRLTDVVLSAVPVEGEDAESRLNLLLWRLTDGRMSGTGYDVDTMVREVEAAFERNAESVEGEVECKHKNTHMRGWTQVCDDCGLGREL